MTNPYSSLPDRAFWRPAVASRSLFDLDDLWRSKFAIDAADPIVTFGSCFAQHIGRALVARGFNWHSSEPAPAGLSEANARRFNYDVFSARTGNIYTSSMLLQWVRWASGQADVPAVAWQKDGRVYDPFRPSIEPNGFKTEREMLANRQASVLAFGRAIETANFFVFTLGLTESWFDDEGRFEYPLCPGTVAGEFDPGRHRFRNQAFGEVHDSLTGAMDLMKKLNPDLRFILTVSPVPLVATNSGNHVLVATMESKSVLRAVAGQAARMRDDTDYFPSYEMISSAPVKGVFFEPNQRNVSPHGVAFVMDRFFRGIDGQAAKKAPRRPVASEAIGPDAAACDEELLQAFEGGS